MKKRFTVASPRARLACTVVKMYRKTQKRSLFYCILYIPTPGPAPARAGLDRNLPVCAETRDYRRAIFGGGGNLVIPLNAFGAR